MVVVNHAAAPIVYRNDQDSGHWLRVDLEGLVSNRDGIGAVITLVADADDPATRQTREIRAGGGYLAQSEMTAHFGLGNDVETIDLISIAWPSGAVQRLYDVDVNRKWSIRESLPGDFNFDNRVDAEDLVAWGAKAGATANGRDWLVWQRYFGRTSSGMTFAVPEPASPMAVGMMLTAVVATRRRRKRRPNSAFPSIGDACSDAFRRLRPLGAGYSLRRSCGPPPFGCGLPPFGRCLALSATRCSQLGVFVLGVFVLGADCRAVDIWVTSRDRSQLLSQQADVVFLPGRGQGGSQITVAPTTEYQTMVGFGAALTDSSAWLMQHALDDAQRDDLLRRFFSPTEGIGISYLRVPMGASDFTASGFYTYNDAPTGGTDVDQSQFSIAHDLDYIVPQLKAALGLNPQLQLMATPWSAPAWMKTNHSLAGGSLATQWEPSYAEYLTRFVEAYAAQGIVFDALTVQNEPQHTSNYPSMAMTASQQARLIGQYLGPLWDERHIDVKLLAYDHNWDNPDYPLEILGDPVAGPYLDGSAFHAYAGAPSAQTTVHNAFPDKSVYFTEITGGGWATNFGDNLAWYADNIFIGSIRNWAETAVMWNLALDQNGGPHQGGCDDCRGVATIDDQTGSVQFNEEFYALGHLARHVAPGAVRIGSTANSTLNTVAFRNPDGSRVLVALNRSTQPQTMRIFENNAHAVYDMPARSLATFVWSDGKAD
ncbi:MAG: ASPIC/UnbV domain-containing protein, partial [Planctomycetales bacterium]|nr:ASPIC/UnbV domain-containing protein [Planctomycetales bacterium]